MSWFDCFWLVLFVGMLVVVVGGCKFYFKVKFGLSQVLVYLVGDLESVWCEVCWCDLLILVICDMQVGNFDVVECKVCEVLKLVFEVFDVLVLQVGIDGCCGCICQVGDYFCRVVELVLQCGDMFNNYGVWLCQQGQLVELLVWFDWVLQVLGYVILGEVQVNVGSCVLDVGQFECVECDLCVVFVVVLVNLVVLELMVQLSFCQGCYMEVWVFVECRIVVVFVMCFVL